MSLGNWLDERTGYRDLVRKALDEEVPGGARWAYVWGSALTMSFITQAVTGVLLMTSYSPSAQTAWASVAYITYTLKAGWIIRGVHHFGAQAMVILLGAHLVQTAIYGAYRKPREVNWYLGLGLLMATLGFALTGYLLPWDQKGYWATRVATNIAGTVPGIGGYLQQLVVGGAEYGHFTLTRFYALHVAVLPAALVLLLVGHIALFRRHGVTPPVSADTRIVEPFYPRQLGKDLAVGIVVLLAIFALAAREHGAPLDAPADPSSDYPARPEWYFLALFELLKYFKGSLEPVGALGIPAVVFGYLFALPLIDKKPDRSLRPRLGFLAVLAVFGAVGGALTWKAMSADASDEGFQKARHEASVRAERSIALFQKGVPPEGPLAMLKNDPEMRGEELFRKACASCHRLGELTSPDGKSTAPDLTGFGSKTWALDLLDSPDSEKNFGHTGFKGKMPSMVHPPADPDMAKSFKPMPTADRDAIAEFLAAQARGEKGTGMPGEKFVSQRCTTCHRLDGKTDDDDSLAPELRGWASLAWIEAQIANPGSGKTYPKGAMDDDVKGHMPAFADKLSDKDRKLLAAFVVSLARP